VRRERLDGVLQHLDRVAAGLLADDLERAVDDLLGRALLAVQQDLVDDLRDELAVVHGIREDLPARDGASARHGLPHPFALVP
jgi:hypothetical protein